MSAKHLTISVIIFFGFLRFALTFPAVLTFEKAVAGVLWSLLCAAFYLFVFAFEDEGDDE